MSLNVPKLITVSVVSAVVATVILSFVLGSSLPEGSSFSVLQYCVMIALFAAVGILPALLAVGRPAMVQASPVVSRPSQASVRPIAEQAASPARSSQPKPKAPPVAAAMDEDDDDDGEMSFNPAYADLPVETGTVKWFNSNKGFGFISRENGEDVFVHFRSVQGKNRYLKPGQTVEFKVVQGDKGIQAEEVSMIS
jgi:CspA family cold shock protein